MVPERVTITELATLWNLTPARISQFIKAGRFRKGSDGKIDRDEAMAFRKAQISNDEIRTMFQRNRDGLGPKILQQTSVDLSDDEILGISLPAATALSGQDQVLTQATKLTHLRMEGEQEKLRRQRLRNDREEGALIQKTDVTRAGLEVGKLLVSIMSSLPAEIASIFAEPDVRPEVRRKVQERVDQMKHALHQAVARYED